MSENAGWAETHFLIGDDFGSFRLLPNPDGGSDTFKDGALLQYREGLESTWKDAAWISDKVLPHLARALMMAAIMAEQEPSA